jgi:hypothetical protein
MDTANLTRFTGPVTEMSEPRVSRARPGQGTAGSSHPYLSGDTEQSEKRARADRPRCDLQQSRQRPAARRARDRHQRSEEAIDAYRKALTAYSRTGSPLGWAMTQNNPAPAARWGHAKRHGTAGGSRRGLREALKEYRVSAYRSIGRRSTIWGLPCNLGERETGRPAWRRRWRRVVRRLERRRDQALSIGR